MKSRHIVNVEGVVNAPITITEFDKFDKYQNGLLVAGFTNIMFVNEVIDYILVDFGNELKKNNMFRHKVKQEYNRMKEVRLKYTNGLSNTLSTTGNGNFFEQADAFYELTKKDYQVFYYTVRQEFLKHLKNDEQYVDLFTHMHILGKVLEFARENYYDWFMQFYKKIPIVFAYKGLYSLDITPLSNRFTMLVVAIFSAIRIDNFHFGNSQTDLAFKVYRRKIGSLKVMVEAMQKAGIDFESKNVDMVERPPHTPMPESMNKWSMEDVL